MQYRSTYLCNVLLVALGLLFTLTTVAMSVETYDPNAGSASSDEPAAQGALSSDARLSAKITYSCKKMAVRNTVGDLMQASGVTLRAGVNTKDWEVRDRKINVFAKDTPLRDIMNAISRVTGFKWSIEGTESTPVYRLVWDMKSRQAMAAAREAILKTQEQAIADRRKAGLDALNSLENLSADELAKLRVENPFMFWLAASGMGKKFGGFLNNSPDVSQALLSGQNTTIAGASLNPQAQQGLSDLLTAVNALTSKLGGRNAGSEVPANMADATITVNAPGRGGRGGGPIGAGLGSLTITTPNGRTRLPIPDPNSQMAKIFGNVLIQADILNRPMRDVMAESRNEFMNARGQNRRNPGSANGTAPGSSASTTTTTTEDGQVVVTQIIDPVLDAKITAKLDGQTFPDIQEQLSEAAGIAIVSDNYGGRPGFGGPQGRRGGPNAGAAIDAQNQTLRTVLDNLANRYRYQWIKPSKPVEFQDSDWLIKVDTLIPDELIEYWKQTLNKTGTLGIPELAQMAGLTQEQFRANVTGDDIFGPLNLQQTVQQNKDILLFFASLSKSQASAAYSRDGLNLRSVVDNSSPIMRKVLGTNTAMTEDTESPVVMTAVRSKEGANFVVDISITNVDEKAPPATWHIVQPSYTPPAKPAK